VSADHDDQRLGVPAPNPRQNLEAIHARHLHVEKGDIGRSLLHHLQPLGTVPGNPNLMTFIFEDLPKGVADGLFVVHYEESCHGELTSGAGGNDEAVGENVG
jgi:hypothetical protein